MEVRSEVKPDNARGSESSKRLNESMTPSSPRAVGVDIDRYCLIDRALNIDTYQSAEQVVVIAPAEMHIFDVFDDYVGRQLSAAVEHDELAAEPNKPAKT